MRIAAFSASVTETIQIAGALGVVSLCCCIAFCARYCLRRWENTENAFLRRSVSYGAVGDLRPRINRLVQQRFSQEQSIAERTPDEFVTIPLSPQDKV